MSHPVVSDERLSGVLGHVVTALEGALVGLVGDQRDVLEELLLEMFVTHVLPEGVSSGELHLALTEGALDHQGVVGGVVDASLVACCILTLGGSTRRHLRLGNVAADNLVTDGFLHLFVSHAVVPDHGRHLLVLVRAEGTLVRRVARLRQEL